MTETITTNENQSKEDKIKRLIQRKIDELDKQWLEKRGGMRIRHEEYYHISRVRYSKTS